MYNIKSVHVSSSGVIKELPTEMDTHNRPKRNHGNQARSYWRTQCREKLSLYLCTLMEFFTNSGV
jgi:hypothetical protein